MPDTWKVKSADFLVSPRKITYLAKAFIAQPGTAPSRLKQFGYSPTQHIKQYGEKFEVISEPFADGNRFVVRVTSETRKTERLLTIPRNIIETAKRT